MILILLIFPNHRRKHFGAQKRQDGTNIIVKRYRKLFHAFVIKFRPPDSIALDITSMRKKIKERSY